MRNILIFIFLSFLTLQEKFSNGQEVIWQQEPKTFKNIPWGASEKDAIKLGNLWGCHNSDKTKKKRDCQGGSEDSKTFMIGDLAMNHSTFYFHNDKFVFADFSFRDKDYEFLKSLFLEKYGPESKRDTEDYTNRMGAKLTNEQLSWTGQDVSIAIVKWHTSPDIPYGKAWIGLNSEFKARAMESQLNRKKALEDF